MQNPPAFSVSQIPQWYLFFPVILFLAGIVLILHAWNDELFFAWNHFFGRFPDMFWLIVTHMGDTTFALALLGFLVMFQPNRFIKMIFFGLLLGVLVQALKHLFGVERPPERFAHDEFNLLGETLRNYSFPSGHATTASFAAGFLAVYFKNRVCVFVSIAVFAVVAVSRVAVGVHFPMDVFVGAALGWGGAMVYWLRIDALCKNGFGLWGEAASFALLIAVAVYQLLRTMPNLGVYFACNVFSAVLIFLWVVAGCNRLLKERKKFKSSS